MAGRESGTIWRVAVDPPVLGNNTADAERLAAALKKVIGPGRLTIPMAILRDLPSLLREKNYFVRCVVIPEEGCFRLAALEGHDCQERVCGVAVDIGTTRIVARLMDLETGQVLDESGFDNPQAVVGPDVLSRIHHAGRPQGLRELRSLVIDGLNSALGESCARAGVSTDRIFFLAAAGNTAMTHLFLGIDPTYLIREPYIPALNEPGFFSARELGLCLNSEARAFLFPNIGSYFGGDLISGILYAGLHQRPDVSIMVDVGTNAEVVIGCRDWLIACAGAAGPALEGGVSDIGMTAGPGVIDRVWLQEGVGEIAVHTIDEQAPVGICGSGMIDLAAALFLSGRIDIRGKFVPERCGNRLVQVQGIESFVLVDRERSGTGEPIVLSQVDLNSLTSSKAAMYTILQVIVEQTAGLSMNDLSSFYVAGTFGSFIDPKSAIAIGMIPDLPLQTYQAIGNSSLEGAALFLNKPEVLDEISQIRRGITYIELNVNAAFMTLFSGSKFYPHTDRSRFPSVRLHGES